MDTSVDRVCPLPSPSPPELPNQHKNATDRARERLLAISQADAGSNLQDVAKCVVGDKGVEKEGESHSQQLHPGEEKTDQAEMYRNKLISISYDDETSLPTFDIHQSNGAPVASPPPADASPPAGDGHGSPPA